MTKTYLGMDIKGDVSEKHLLIGLLSRFDNRYRAAADEFFGEISWTQLFCMKGIGMFKRPPSIRDMANFLGCSHQNAAQLLKKLVSAGYVRFETDGIDRRKQRLYLTELAEGFLREHGAAADRAMNEIFAPLSEAEIRTAVGILQKLDDSLTEYEKVRNIT